jgi:hypothetical protein
MVFSLRHALFLGLANLAAASSFGLRMIGTEGMRAHPDFGEVPEKHEVPLKELEEERA